MGPLLCFIPNLFLFFFDPFIAGVTVIVFSILLVFSPFIILHRAIIVAILLSSSTFPSIHQITTTPTTNPTYPPSFSFLSSYALYDAPTIAPPLFLIVVLVIFLVVEVFFYLPCFVALWFCYHFSPNPPFFFPSVSAKSSPVSSSFPSTPMHFRVVAALSSLRYPLYAVNIKLALQTLQLARTDTASKS